MKNPVLQFSQKRIKHEFIWGLFVQLAQNTEYKDIMKMLQISNLCVLTYDI